MLEKTLGIVLHIIPYNDKISVAHLYTEQYGPIFLSYSTRGRKKSSHVSVPLHAVLYFGTRYRLPEQSMLGLNPRKLHNCSRKQR